MFALFGWEIQPATTVFSSHAKSASQPANQQCFPLTPNQPAIQPASQPNKSLLQFFFVIDALRG